MADTLTDILEKLPQIRESVMSLREVLVANIVMFGEIPGPTFGEAQRIEFLQQRFAEDGLQNCSTDEVGNGLGILPGLQPEKNILVVAHSDTVHPDTVDHTVTLQADSASGPGVADNSCGLAVLSLLPTLLEHLGIQLKSNLVLMGGVQSLGRGNLQGLRFFLANHTMPIRAGVCLEGVQLGRLSYCSIGMLRAEIICKVPDEYDWTRFGTTNAIITLNDVINRIIEIPLPRRPKTTIVMGSIEGGTSFNTIPTEARLRLEIRSEEADIVNRIAEEVQDIVAEVSSHSDSAVHFDVIAKRDPGGVRFNHPLIRHSRHVLRTLGTEDRFAPSVSELAAFIDRGIPALTIGLTTGEHINEKGETIQITPLLTGVTQLVGILMAIDEGLCDDD